MPQTYGGLGTGQWISVPITITTVSGNFTYPLPSITSGTTFVGTWPYPATTPAYTTTPVPRHRDAWITWNQAFDDVDRARAGLQRGVAPAPNEVYRQRRAEARNRASELLRLLLTAEQWRAYEAQEAFEVVGSLGRRYRIKHGVSGNIAIIEDGAEVARICAHPEVYDPGTRADLPTEDVLIGQLLHLTSDEESFLRVANVHHGRVPELRAA